jgi:hypothetical protein
MSVAQSKEETRITDSMSWVSTKIILDFLVEEDDDVEIGFPNAM